MLADQKYLANARLICQRREHVSGRKYAG